MLIMGVAAEADAIRIMRTRPRPSVDVIVFEHAGFRAPVPVLVDESAPGLVAQIDLASDGGGHGPPAAACCLLRHASGTRLAADSESLLLHLLDEEVDRQIDDACQVARGKAVAEQILSLAELVAESPTRGELHFVGLLGERRDRPLYRPGRRMSRCERKLRRFRRR